jgi:hypothetical protein
MRVGLHEAIHGTGINPNTMNSGAQTALALFEAVCSLCNFVDIASINPKTARRRTGIQ